MAPIAFLRRPIFSFSDAVSSMGSHWKGVNGLGTKGLACTVMLPTTPFFAPFLTMMCLIRFTSSGMPSMSFFVSL
ncbi:MAG: hypothetical protein A4E64_00044 [Syntrophorhabdus sp. PtaU1.Bin058]|nr:MAG: hypothetical protein A4E64_00044 [Syntrophorhabdus sp. PtaU1.Bin058]